MNKINELKTWSERKIKTFQKEYNGIELDKEDISFGNTGLFRKRLEKLERTQGSLRALSIVKNFCDHSKYQELSDCELLNRIMFTILGECDSQKPEWSYGITSILTDMSWIFSD